MIEVHPRNISTKLFENQPDTFGGEDFLSVAMETRILHGQVVIEEKSFEAKSLRMHAQQTIHHDISSTCFQPVELKNKEYNNI